MKISIVGYEISGFDFDMLIIGAHVYIRRERSDRSIFSSSTKLKFFCNGNIYLTIIKYFFIVFKCLDCLIDYFESFSIEKIIIHFNKFHNKIEKKVSRKEKKYKRRSNKEE